MREIELTQGKVALVDDGDYERLAQYKWSAKREGNVWYAVRNVTLPDGTKTVSRMHWEVIGKPRKGYVTDHIDGDGLNNQRHNLRHVSHRVNLLNCRKRKDKTSKYRGVSFHKPSGKWRAQITHHGKVMYIGIYNTEEDAAKAWDEAAINLRGELAKNNFERRIA